MNATEENINAVFASQQQQKFILRSTDAKVRIAKLKKLKYALQNFEALIFEALQTDLRKSIFETAVTELFFTYAEIDHAIKKLKSWMKPKSVGRVMSSLFAGNKIYYEPKGVCLIIAPWNYPLQLVMGPLISAIAAGNCVIIKPSELSTATSKVICKLISNTFNENEIACFEGDQILSTNLLKLPFDHIFFTGSTTVGKIVMQAASKNLSSVTLELGGKSPVIIDETADLRKAAAKIAWGKFVNAGQTCIAPDYILIDEKLEVEFIRYFKEATLSMFFKDTAEINKEAYGKIINEKQFKRLKALIEDAIKDGANLEWGGKTDENDLTVLPTVLSHVNAENTIMQDEIFGPILPIISFKKLQEAIAFVHTKAKPLALYIFSGSKKNQQDILLHTSAGGTCINDVLIHISNPNLPFGGVNSSGIGSCHGIFGFKNFSHERAVVLQSRFGMTKMIYPPYKEKMGMLKWLKKIL